MNRLLNLTVHTAQEIRSDGLDTNVYVNAVDAGEIINDLLHEIWILRGHVKEPVEKKRLVQLVQGSLEKVEELRGS